MTDFNKPIDNADQPMTVDWTQEKYMRFRRHYANALDSGKGQFVFEGHGFLTGYAKYLIEHLEGKFK